MTRVWHKHCGPLPTPSVGLTTFPKVSLLPRVVSILFVCLEIDGSTCSSTIPIVTPFLTRIVLQKHKAC